MRAFMFGVAIILVLVIGDYIVTGGLYTTKFLEMTEKIAGSFSR